MLSKNEKVASSKLARGSNSFFRIQEFLSVGILRILVTSLKASNIFDACLAID